MAEKQNPGGFYPPNSGMPSAPPSYQEAFGAQYPDPSKGQTTSGYSAPYPTASGAPPYYQQGQQAMAPYPNYSQPFQPAINSGYPYAGGAQPNAQMGAPGYPYAGGAMPNAHIGAQHPSGPNQSPYPKVQNCRLVQIIQL